MLNRDEAKQLVEKALSFSKAGECAVTVGALDLAQTRFAANSITTSGKSSGMAINISVTKDRRTGTVATNEASNDSLHAAVERAEALAGFAPQDPEYVEPLSPQKYPETSSFDAATSRAGQKEMIPGIKAAIDGAEKQKLRAAGYYELETESLALGNKRGNFAYAQRTDAEFSLTVRTADGTGSGWASAESVRMGDLDASRIAGIAIDKSVLSQKSRPIEPGKYTVVLEPAAVSGLMLFMFGGFDARAAEEGRSLLTKKGGGTRLGEKLFSEKITARTDPFDPRQNGLPWSGNVATSLGGTGQGFFGGGGDSDSFLPAEKITWIEKGVVKNLGYSRYWAKQRKAKPTP
ncbi:MAG: metallopeptidase TldD-related protein, partial [Terriglobales bacterium]